MSTFPVHLPGIFFRIYPRIRKELRQWEAMARKCPDEKLKQLALASLKLKRFHCQGGAVFSAWAPPEYRKPLLRAIIALQTISDYLDNLCDRAGLHDGASFAQLHRAFLDALEPAAAMSNYYSLYPYREDGGYLNSLARACRQAIASLPGYAPVKEHALTLAKLYCTLQVNKHLVPHQCEERLVAWLKPLLAQNRELFWWELAAATGSTLGIFALLALAARPAPPRGEIEKINRAYFPWIGGLHILLDYLIDQAEDRQEGDLNFTFYYSGPQETGQRLQFFFAQSLQRVEELSDPAFHRLIVRGLPALYLSDPKVRAQNFLPAAGDLLRAAGPQGEKLYRFCNLLRRAGVI
ncbi:MAG: tetraprenyl-beta-curcumene synthase family protein [Bacillota bacterium]